MKFIIDFKNDASSLDIDSYLSTNGCTVVKTYSAFDKVYLVDSQSQPNLDVIVESIIDDTANQIDLLSIMSWTTTEMDDWWKVASALKPDLSVQTISYEKPVVNSILYMLDSGIDASHTEFANARVENLFSFNDDFTDYNGHGTALASVIVGDTCGIVDARTKSVKIFQNGTPTLVSDLLSAFDAIIQDSQQYPQYMKVLNMSWSISKNQYVEDKIQQLIDYGFIVTTSAGNNGTPIENVTPASMEAVITVGAYDDNFDPCDFSNYTGYLQTAEGTVNYGALDSWAPGKDIKVANIDGSLAFTAGTSVASAIQAAALLFNSKFHELSDGSILETYRTKQIVLSHSIGRSNILNLTGQYEGSISAIATIITEKAGENGLGLPKITNIKWKVVDGEALPGVNFFSRNAVQSYDASGLPEGLYFDNGYLLGTMSISEPALIPVEIPVTYIDGSQDIVTLTIIAVPQGVTGNEPWLSEEVSIALTTTGTCNSSASCDGSCSFATPNCINCGTAKDVNCNCFGDVPCDPGL